MKRAPFEGGDGGEHAHLSLAELKARLAENVSRIDAMIDFVSEKELFQPHRRKWADDAIQTAVWEVYKLMNGKFCGEAWDAISRYVYTALQGGSIMHKWTNDDRMMIACCNDGTRPVIFKIERIDIPENEEEEEEQWLAKQNFKNTAEDAYTG